MNLKVWIYMTEDRQRGFVCLGRKVNGVEPWDACWTNRFATPEDSRFWNALRNLNKHCPPLVFILNRDELSSDAARALMQRVIFKLQKKGAEVTTDDPRLEAREDDPQANELDEMLETHPDIVMEVWNEVCPPPPTEDLIVGMIGEKDALEWRLW